MLVIGVRFSSSLLCSLCVRICSSPPSSVSCQVSGAGVRVTELISITEVRGVECVARAGARQQHGHNRPRGAQRPQPPVQPPGAALAITLSCLPTLYTHSTDSLYYMITLYTHYVSYDHPVGASQPRPRQAALHR